MKYTIEKSNHCTFSIFEKNKLFPRAYFIPFKEKSVLKATDFRSERYSSDMVKVLSGEWDFKFYPKKSKLPDTINTSRVKFDKIHVPSTWQRTGYQEPVYLNERYEFISQPPNIPEDMPVGVYRKLFDVRDVSKNYILTFLGVSSCIDLYVNGSFVGYSEGSHNSAEFDITKYLKEGENELLAVSFKWCNGSFLEAQDMFRENGIFRDVYITVNEPVFVYDYQLKTAKQGDKYNLTAEVELKGDTKDCEVEIEIIKDGKEFATAGAGAEEHTVIKFTDLSVKEWTAETPELYDVYITLKQSGKELMSIRNFTGFRTIEIRGEVFTVNGSKIKMKGVNHHDTHPTKGYAMGLDDLERDIKLMKELNVNTVRTSHYPPDPFFLTLADVYGIYVIDEADIETHGIGRLTGDYCFISHDLKWAKHYVDRVKRMFYRDRNHACVTLWSLGNEAGGYKCHDKCYAYLKAVTEIPVHYEGVVRTRRHSYDVISEMYPSHENLRKMINHKRGKQFTGKPEVLCEYVHAMGVGPGGLQEYWDIFNASDQFMGGCVWEWADHAVYHEPGDKKYPFKYTYGGDHGEKMHDGHFCVDGMVYPDRTPHTGAILIKTVYRPVTAKAVSDDEFVFTNTNNFISTDYLDIRWELLCDGEVRESGTLKLDIPANSSKTIKIPHMTLTDWNSWHINFIYTDGDRHVATEQITLRDVPIEYEFEISDAIAVSRENEFVTVGFEGGEVRFNAETGALSSYVKDGKEYINQTPAEGLTGLLPLVFRALLDNDAKQRQKWLDAGLDKAQPVLKSFETRLLEREVQILTDIDIVYKKKALYNVKTEYLVSGFGAVEVSSELTMPKNSKAPNEIPRFGLVLQLKKEFDKVKYFGRGERENLPDMKAHAPVGIYETTVEAMHEPYIYPQDNGERTEVKWLSITDEQGRGIKVYANDKFAFNAHNYTVNALYEAQHQEDLKEQPTTVLTLDGAIRGTGTASCGPDTLPEYVIDASEGLAFSFTILPL